MLFVFKSKICDQISFKERPFNCYAEGGGGAGLEDVYGPGHFFFTRDAVLSFYLFIIQYVR